jgi:DNA-binding NarL/FixJ family response regulator
MKKNTKKTPIKLKRSKILIVDDHPIVRRGLTQIINLEKDVVVCGESDNIQDALDAIKRLTPNLVLVDISLQDQNGLELIKDIKKRYPRILMLALSMHDETFYAERALRAGAKGYIMKQQLSDSILKAMRKVISGGVYLSGMMSDRILRKVAGGNNKQAKSAVSRLSDREFEVFRLIGAGFGTRQIAQKLSRSLKTIETYREHIKHKLDFKDSSELVQNAIQWSHSNPNSS